MDKKFKLEMLEEAVLFVNNLPLDVANKIYYNIDRVLSGEQNSELFKKIKNTEIWEFRTLYAKQAYRLFAFWDTKNDKIIVATHGLIKKTQKTPAKEINKAETIMKSYFSNLNY